MLKAASFFFNKSVSVIVLRLHLHELPKRQHWIQRRRATSSNHIERRNAAGSLQRHIHTDINTCKYLHILSTHKTQEHNQLHLCKTILSQFLPTHFSSTERPKLYKKAQGTTASDAGIPNYKIPIASQNTRGRRFSLRKIPDIFNNRDPTNTTTGVWSLFYLF